MQCVGRRSDIININDSFNKGIKKVLFIQSIPCIRTNKVATALSERGIQVDIIYLAMHPKQVYKDIEIPYRNIYRCNTVKKMIEFVNESDYDILYSANEPDYLTVIFGCTNKPIIHDCHDMMSIRSKITNEQLALEYVANSNSDGNIYLNSMIKEIALNKFDLGDKPILTLHSYPEKDMLPKKYYTKLSTIDGESHCVYEGGLSNDKKHHRFLEDVFYKFAENKVHVHLYSAYNPAYINQLQSQSEYIHYEGVAKPEDLITELTKYDFGLSIFNINNSNRFHLTTASPNKVWDYLGAGIPIIFSNFQSFRNFLSKNKVGVLYNPARDIKEQVEEVKAIEIDKEIMVKKKWLMNEAVDDLIDFLAEVKMKYKR